MVRQQEIIPNDQAEILVATEIDRLRADLQNKIDDLRQEIMSLLPKPSTESAPEGMEVFIFGPVYCPECGLPMEGYSATGLRAQKYTHPFGASVKLNGQQCKWKGRNFSPPKIFLKLLVQ